MQFQFPIKQLLSEFHTLGSQQQLRKTLLQFKHIYAEQNVNLSYQVRSWRNYIANIDKIGAYCNLCDCKLIYEKAVNQTLYSLKKYISSHKHAQNYERKGSSSKLTSKRNNVIFSLDGKKARNQIKKSQKRQFHQKDKQRKVICMQLIVRWTHNFEKALKRLIRKNAYLDEGVKYINVSMIRKSIDSSSQVLGQEQKQSILQRQSLWNSVGDQLINRLNFRKINLTAKDGANPASNLIDNLFIRQDSLIQGKQRKVVYLIRRQVQVCPPSQQQEADRIDTTTCLIAFEMDPRFLPKLLWFTLTKGHAGNAELENAKVQIQNLLSILIQVQSIYTFQNCTVIIENDDKLLNSFQLLKKVLNACDQQNLFGFCIHPIFVDRLLKCQEFTQPEHFQLYRRLTRVMTQERLKEQLLKVEGQRREPLIARSLKAYKQHCCLSLMNDDQMIGMSYLEEDFFSRNSLKVPFISISDALNIITPISCIQLMITIFTTFLNYQRLFICEPQTALQQIQEINAKLQINYYFSFINPNQSQSLKTTIYQIINNEKYQFKLLISSCPRVVVQLIYQLIIEGFKIMVQKIDLQQIVLKKQVKLKYKNSQRQIRVKYIAQDYNQKQQKKLKKLWFCDCKHYQKYGVPCEHQIISALSFQTSLYDEISQNWKNEEPKKNVQTNFLITDYLNQFI